MKRNNLIKNGFVRRTIVWAMTIMMAFTPAVSGLNSLTVYAAESDGTPTDETSADEPKTETSKDDEGHKVETTTEKSTEYHSDGEKVTDTKEIEATTKKETLDKTEVETKVTNVETHYKVVDDDGNVKTTKNDQGEVVDVEIAQGEADKITEVVVIDTTVADATTKDVTTENADAVRDPNYEVISQDTAIVYGSIDSNGKFTAGEKGADGVKAYAMTDATTDAKYVETAVDESGNPITAYVVKDVNVGNIIIDEDTANALKGEKVDGLTREEVFYIEDAEGNQVKIEDETQIQGLTAKDDKKEALTMEVKPETDAETNETKYYVEVTDKASGESKHVYVKEDNITAVKCYEVKKGDNVLCTVDAVTAENLQKKNFTEAHDMYAVEDGDGNTQYYKKELIQVLHQVTYTEVTKYYYTATDKYEKKSIDIKTSEDGKDVYYQLQVKFWNSTYIPDMKNMICQLDENDKNTVNVVIPYSYLNENGVMQTEYYTKQMGISEFGISRIATLTIHYTPTTTIKDEVVNFDKAVETKETGIENGVVVNGEGDKPTESSIIDHVDILYNPNVGITGVQDAKVTSVTISYKAANGTIKYIEVNDNSVEDGNSHYMEFITKGGYGALRKDNISYNTQLTVVANIEYTKNDKTYSFPYTSLVYMEKYSADPDSINACVNWTKGGFDYRIPLKQQIENHIKREVEIKKTTTMVREGKDVQKAEILAVGAFVRYDRIEQLENGGTHYPVPEYTSNLAKDGNEIVLVYTREGYAVYNVSKEDGSKEVYSKMTGEYKTTQEAIEAYFASNSSQLDNISTKYIEEGKYSEGNTVKQVIEDTIRSTVEAEILKLRQEYMAAHGWTEADTIDWIPNTAEEIEAAIQQAVNTAYVNWYVLKVESGDANFKYHIDGVLTVPAFTIGVNGEIRIPEIIIPTPPTPTPGPGTPTPTPRTTTTTTIAATPTPLAATPEVLGATRTIEEEPTALAATPEAAVLGADRNPQTGDSTNLWVWLMGMIASAGALAGWGVYNKKSKKEDEE